MAIPAGVGRQVAVVLYGVAMAAVIVGIDFVFFRNRFWDGEYRHCFGVRSFLLEISQASMTSHRLLLGHGGRSPRTVGHTFRELQKS